MLPGFMIDNDPSYSTALITNLGSIGIDGVFHHLFNWGNSGVIIAIGKIKKAPVLDSRSGEGKIASVLDIYHDAGRQARRRDVLRQLAQSVQGLSGESEAASGTALLFRGTDRRTEAKEERKRGAEPLFRVNIVIDMGCYLAALPFCTRETMAGMLASCIAIPGRLPVNAASEEYPGRRQLQHRMRSTKDPDRDRSSEAAQHHRPDKGYVLIHLQLPVQDASSNGICAQLDRHERKHREYWGHAGDKGA
ncbi:MAG: hypothetical protein MZU97_26920 [Bacillus subtilis]|nr:hypothetical protein [Bacillus subtilis]